MADGQGYLRFPEVPILREWSNPIIDGEPIEGQLRAFADSWDAPGVRIQMLDRSHLLQHRILAQRAPLTVAPFQIPCAMLCRRQDQFLRLLDLSRSGVPFSLFASWPHTDVWLLLTDPTATTWRSSRRTAWDGSTITHATHPPQAWLDDGNDRTEQEIVTVAPGAGEIQVPTSQTFGQGYFTVTTPDILGYERLSVLYWPEYIARFEDCRLDVVRANELVFNATLTEMRPALPDL